MWENIVNVKEYENKKINYLQIGLLNDLTISYIMQTYAKNEESKIFCIDKWSNEESYQTFLRSIKDINKKKLIIRRGISYKEIQKFPDTFFDVIYINGSKFPANQIEDLVFSFRKLKYNGLMIYNEINWGVPNPYKNTIGGFYSNYQKILKYLGCDNTQLLFKKYDGINYNNVHSTKIITQVATK